MLSERTHVSMTPSELNRYLETWDEASKVKRVKILSQFIEENSGRTGPEIERHLCDCASLFFTRLTAWLRLSYMNASDISVQLKALLLFLQVIAGLK